MSLRPLDGVPRVCAVGRILNCQSQDAAERRVVSLNHLVFPGGEGEAQAAEGAELSGPRAASSSQL